MDGAKLVRGDGAQGCRATRNRRWIRRGSPDLAREGLGRAPRRRCAPVEKQDQDVERRERKIGKEEEAGEEGEGSCGGHRRQGSPELRELMLLIAGGDGWLDPLGFELLRGSREGGRSLGARAGGWRGGWMDGSTGLGGRGDRGRRRQRLVGAKGIWIGLWLVTLKTREGERLAAGLDPEGEEWWRRDSEDGTALGSRVS